MDQALVMQAAELRILAELLVRHPMTAQERKKRPLAAITSDVLGRYRQASMLEMDARGATLDAICAWMAIQGGETRGHYGALEKQLPVLLTARSVMYVPAVLLLLEKGRMTVPVAVRLLQAARNQIGKGPVRAVVSMMAPELVVPESPRLDVQLFGVPRASLDGRELELPARAMVLLAIMVTLGGVSMAQLAAEYEEDFPSDNTRKKAVIALRDALAGGSGEVDVMTHLLGDRGTYGLQRYDVHSDYTDLPHMTPSRRQLLVRSAFLGQLDSPFAAQIRMTIAR